MYHFCRGKATRVKYSECVFVALGIQHAIPMRHCHLWPLRLYNIFFFHIILKNGMVFEKKLLNIKHVF